MRAGEAGYCGWWVNEKKGKTGVREGESDQWRLKMSTEALLQEQRSESERISRRDGK